MGAPEIPPSPPGQPVRRRREVSILSLLPNVMTLAAICAGLSAIRFAILGRFELALLLILLAAVLDGIDGRLARMLKSESAIGAELDSLADFVNFGVAPPMVLYLWALQDLRSFGWIAVLIFAVCAVLRLARFNVAAKSETPVDPRYFTGVPAPAGALLVLLPLFASYAFGSGPFPILPLSLMSLYIVFVGLLMVSQIKTWSLKSFSVPQGKVRYVMVAIVAVVATFFTFPWTTLVVLDLAYLAMVAVAFRRHLKRPGRAEEFED